MEHRYHPRVSLDISMLIYRSGMPVGTGRIRDASKVGLFVVTDYAELREHQPLQFEFRFGCEPPMARHRINAHVRRRTAEGVALEIDELDDAARAALGSLLGGSAKAMETARFASAGG